MPRIVNITLTNVLLLSILLILLAVITYVNLSYMNTRESVTNSLIGGSSFHIYILADDIEVLASNYYSDDPVKTNSVVISAMINSKALATISKTLYELNDNDLYRKWVIVYNSLFRYFADLTGMRHEDVVKEIAEDKQVLEKIASILEQSGNTSNPFGIPLEKLDDLISLVKML